MTLPREPMLRRPRTRLGGLLLVSSILAFIGWICDYAVNTAVETRHLGVIAGDEVQMVCNLPWLGVVILGPVWLYRRFKDRRAAYADKDSAI